MTRNENLEERPTLQRFRDKTEILNERLPDTYAATPWREGDRWKNEEDRLRRETAALI
jgi:hypothetical protein